MLERQKSNQVMRQSLLSNFDKGYTRISNEMLECLTRHTLTLRQIKVILAILRKTNGFNKTSDWISNKQLAGLTGLPATRCSTIKHELLNRNILLKQGRHIGVNHEIAHWQNKQHNLIESVTNTVNISVTDLSKESFPNQANTKETSNKKQLVGSNINTNLLDITSDAAELLDYFNHKMAVPSNDIEAFSQFMMKSPHYKKDQIKQVIDWWARNLKLDGTPNDITSNRHFENYLIAARIAHSNRLDCGYLIEAFNSILADLLPCIYLTPEIAAQLYVFSTSLQPANNEAFIAYFWAAQMLFNKNDFYRGNNSFGWKADFKYLMSNKGLQQVKKGGICY